MIERKTATRGIAITSWSPAMTRHMACIFPSSIVGKISFTVAIDLSSASVISCILAGCAFGLLLIVLRGEERADLGFVPSTPRVPGVGKHSSPGPSSVEVTKQGRAPRGTIDLVELAEGEWNVYLDGRRVGVAVDGGHSHNPRSWVCPSRCGPSPRKKRHERSVTKEASVKTRQPAGVIGEGV